MDGVVDVLAIQALNADFAHHFDRDEVEAVLALFTADAVYDNGRRRCEGREALAAYLRERTASGPRTTRHFYSGLRVAFEGAERARGTSLWVSYAGNAPPPVTPAQPFMVADFRDVYVRGPGGWLIRERVIEPVFVTPSLAPRPAAG